MALKLKRELGLFEATAYGIGIIIGAGIYALIGIAAGYAGNMLWLSFAIGAIVATFTGLSYAELSSMYPKEAAEYVYLKRASHNEFYAFLVGWLIMFTGIISISTVSIAFANYFTTLFPILSPMIVSILIIVLLSFLNFSGIKESSKVNVFLISVTIAGLILVIFLGLPKLGSVNYLEMSGSLSGVFAAATLIFFAYLGFEDIVNVSQETKKPTRVMPRALMLAVLISSILYILTSVSAVSLANWKDISESEAPLAFAASNSFLGQNAFYILSVVALFATISTILGILVVTSRMMYGMSAEGSLPKILSRLHRKTRTPWVAIILVTIISIAFLFSGNLEKIANLTSIGALATFVTVNASLIWLRIRKPKAKRPFKTPLNIGKYPIIAVLGIVSASFMILQSSYEYISMAMLVVGVGAFFYVLRKKGIIMK